MIEIKGDLFSHDNRADLVCITTNGFIQRDGSNTMGAGCAGEAKKRWPGIELLAGGLIRASGNNVHLLTVRNNKGNGATMAINQGFWILPYHLATFPTKPKQTLGPMGRGVVPGWKSKSLLPIIERSAKQLVELVDQCGFQRIIIPRPGCGLGGLSWEQQVKPLLEPIFNDNRFLIISN